MCVQGKGLDEQRAYECSDFRISVVIRIMVKKTVRANPKRAMAMETIVKRFALVI